MFDISHSSFAPIIHHHIICYNHTVHDNTQPHQLLCSSWRAGNPYGCVPLSLLEHSFGFSKGHAPAFCSSQSKLLNGQRLTFCRAATPLVKLIAIWLTNSAKKTTQALVNNSKISSFYFLLWVGFFFPSSIVANQTQKLFFSLHDMFNTMLIRSILTCN